MDLNKITMCHVGNNICTPDEYHPLRDGVGWGGGALQEKNKAGPGKVNVAATTNLTSCRFKMAGLV